MLKCIAIDDEPLALRQISAYIAKIPYLELAATFNNAIEAQQRLASERVDLIFVDINMPDLNGVDFVRALTDRPMVVFTTAYDEYAVRAFSVSSIDYILKPVDEERLAEAIARYEELRGRMLPPDDYLETLLDALQRREKRFRTRFLIAGADRFLTLPVEDVAYFYSENKVTTAVTFAGRNHVVDLPLSRLEEQLDPDRFFRANRQVLLSVGAIDRLEPYFNGKVSVTVHPPHKERITVSEERVPLFKAWLNY